MTEEFLPFNDAQEHETNRGRILKFFSNYFLTYANIGYYN